MGLPWAFLLLPFADVGCSLSGAQLAPFTCQHQHVPMNSGPASPPPAFTLSSEGGQNTGQPACLGLRSHLSGEFTAPPASPEEGGNGPGGPVHR